MEARTMNLTRLMSAGARLHVHDGECAAWLNGKRYPVPYEEFHDARTVRELRLVSVDQVTGEAVYMAGDAA